MKRHTSQKKLLPVSSPLEDMETISRSKLSLLFDPSLFEIRQELQRDKGIDLIVELKQDKSYTNFRFVIQLKSTTTIKASKNKSISYPVDVANINYLLNYGMPAYYILYDHLNDVFYLERAHIVFQALIRKYTPVEFPKQFKVRFSKQLDEGAIKGIYQETLENGLLLRQINAHLNSPLSATGRTTGMIIDDENEVYSVEQNMEFINSFGFMLLNRSEFKRIIEIEQRTHPRTAASPIFNLVCGIAYFHQSSLFKAIDFLKSANNHASTFDPPVRSMLIYTFLHAKHLLGMIGETDFKNGITELMQAEQLGSFLELEKAYTTFLEGEKPFSFRIDTLQSKVLSLITAEPNNPSLRIRAYSIVLNIEGKQLIHNLPLNFALLCGRVPDLLVTRTYKQWAEFDKQHTERLRSLLKYCLDTHNFLASSNIVMDITEWTYHKLFVFYVLKNWNSKSLVVKGKLNSEELDVLSKEADKIDQVIKGYEMLEHRENIIHALSFKYELLNFAGRTNEANATAALIASHIEQHDMNALKSNFQSLINGDSRYNKFIAHFAQHMNNIYRVAKNSGIEKYFTQPLSLERLKYAEFIEEGKKWIDGEFFELDFPTVNVS